MLPFGEMVVWMMSKDSRRRNKLESTHPFGVFAGIVSRTGEFVVSGAARIDHKLSEDQKWDTENMSRVKGAPWDFKASAGDDVNSGGIRERESGRSPTRSTDGDSDPHQCEKNLQSQGGC